MLLAGQRPKPPPWVWYVNVVLADVVEPEIHLYTSHMRVSILRWELRSTLPLVLCGLTMHV